jgi:hypothetical protein
MEYYHQEKYKIAADLALRIGRIAKQYRDLRLPEDCDYDITLNLCLLQTLLSQCKELIKKMGRRGGADLGLHNPISNSGWGLEHVEVEADDFEGELTVARFLNHLRNAMCHPTEFNPEKRIPSSGYTSIPDGSNKIRKLAFCDSPDTVEPRNQKACLNPRIFNAILTASQLRDLVLNLSNLLANASSKDWDGKTITYVLEPAAA